MTTVSPVVAGLFFAALWAVVIAIALFPERKRPTERRTFTPTPRKRRKP